MSNEIIKNKDKNANIFKVGKNKINDEGNIVKIAAIICGSGSFTYIACHCLDEIIDKKTPFRFSWKDISINMN